MKLEINKQSQFLQDSYGDSIKIDTFHDPYNILSKLLKYKSNRLDEHNIKITKENLSEYFEPIEDFNKLVFNKNTNKFECISHYYKHKTLNVVLHISEMDKKNTFDIWTIYSNLDDMSDDDVTMIINKLNTYLLIGDNSNQIKILLQDDSGLTFKPFDISPKKIDIEKMYNDDFKSVHEHIVNSLSEGDKGIVLLHGDAGSGKTNYIKNLTHFVPNKTFVFVAPEMIGELTSPKFIGELIENKNSILVLEDAEKYLKDRDSSNDNNNIISTLLNISDGILSDILNIQIICTFNTKITNIDDALKRKGRLIAEYHFQALKKEKVKVLFDDLGIVDEPTDLVLTEIFNRNKDFKLTKIKTKLGFTNN